MIFLIFAHRYFLVNQKMAIGTLKSELINNLSLLRLEFIAQTSNVLSLTSGSFSSSLLLSSAVLDFSREFSKAGLHYSYTYLQYTQPYSCI